MGHKIILDFSGGSVVKNLPADTGDSEAVGLIPGVGKIPWRRKWQPSVVLLSDKPHGHRSLVGYSPWEREESDMT